MTRGSRSTLGTTLLGSVAMVVCVLPAFLTGALAVQLTTDLVFGAAGLGAAVAMFWATSAATSLFLGRLPDRLGAIWSLRLATTIAAVASLGIAITATSWATLVAWLMVGGSALALGQPATNRLLVHVVRPEQLGMALGLKQSAPSVALMLAGLSVPAIGLTVGWRWAYILAGSLAVALMPAIGRRRPAAQETGRPDRSRAKLHNLQTIFVLSVALGLGIGAMTTVPVFYVEAAVRAGSSQQFAGILLASASVAAIMVQISTGLACDRIATGHLRVCARLLITGSLGFVLLSIGLPAAMSAGVVIALAGAWGFNTAFWFALLRAYPASPGSITGAVMPGGLIGSIISPLLFGILAESLGYSAAWIFAGTLAILAALLMLLVHRLNRLSQCVTSYPQWWKGDTDAVPKELPKSQ